MKPARSASSFITFLGATLFAGGFSLWGYGIFLACQWLNVPRAARIIVIVAVGMVSAAIVFSKRPGKARKADPIEIAGVQEPREAACSSPEPEQAVLRRMQVSPPFQCSPPFQ